MNDSNIDKNSYEWVGDYDSDEVQDKLNILNKSNDGYYYISTIPKEAPHINGKERLGIRKKKVEEE